MNHLQNRTITKRKSALLFENMIIERIGRHEVLLPINQNNEKFEKQQLIRRNAQHQRAHMTHSVHLHRHDVSSVLLHLPITNMTRTCKLSY